MKILFLNLPYSGHVIPTIGLVQELVRAGHRVTYLLPQDWQDHTISTGAEFLGYDNSPKLDIQIRNAFRKAESVIEGYDLLIYEQFFFLGKHLAEKHGKKCVRIFTAPATNQDLMRQFLASGGPMGIFRVPLIGRLWTADTIKGLDVRLKCRNWLDEIIENPPQCNLVYILEQFQPCIEDFPKDTFHFLGPSVYDRQEEDFPQLSGSVVYVSLGTILKGQEHFFRACIDAFREEDLTLVLSTGGKFDIRSLGKLPPKVILRNRLPQINVLKQSSLFITHGGMNSVSEAMTQGVPMLVIPFVSDQPVNARQVERLGLGKVLHPKDVTAESIRACARSILAEESIKQNLRSIQETIRHAPGNSGAVAIIEQYFRD